MITCRASVITPVQLETFLEKCKTYCMEEFPRAFRTRDKAACIGFYIFFSFKDSTSSSFPYFKSNVALEKFPEATEVVKVIEEQIFAPLRKKWEEESYPTFSSIELQLTLVAKPKGNGFPRVLKSTVTVSPQKGIHSNASTYNLEAPNP